MRFVILILLFLKGIFSVPDLVLDIMKVALSDIQDISTSPCNIEIIEKLEKFIKYEKAARSWTLCLEKAVLLEKIVNDFMEILDDLLQDQRHHLDDIRTSVLTDIEIFDHATDDLLLEIEANTDSSTIVALELKILSIVSDHLRVLNSALIEKRKCHKIVDTISGILKFHSEWITSANMCALIEEGYSTLTREIRRAEIRAELLADAFSDSCPEHVQAQESITLSQSPAIDPDEPEPTESIITYDSLGELKHSERPDSKMVPRINTRFIFSKNPEEIVVKMAKIGFKVIWVQQKEDYLQDFAILLKGIRLEHELRAGILKMSPLALESLPHLLDRHATNDDGHLIVNIKGQEELKKRMFLPFHTASHNGFDTLVIDCSFGQGAPYLNHPANLGFTYLAAAASFSGSRLLNFVITGDIYSPFCTEIMGTMGIYYKYGLGESD